MSGDKKYKNRYLDGHTDVLLSCLEEKGEISKPTSKEIKSHISLLSYSYITSSRETDWINEILMLLIGALVSVFISSLASSIFIEITKFNYIIVIILVVLILIRIIRR